MLCPTNDLVRARNTTRLRSLGTPVATIKAVHTGSGAKIAASELSKGLQPKLTLAVGAEVMLISRNLAVPFKLFNGATGVVTHIYYKPDQGPPASLPLAIFVLFENYSGPPFFTDDPKIVPIVPIRQEWDSARGNCSRTQIPLTLSYAISIYKSQGSTYDLYFADIGIKELAVGSTYVCISRSTELQSIALTPHDIASNRLTRWVSIGNSQMMTERKAEDIRLLTLEQALFTHLNVVV
jgi:ATP-dependent exoDNAse (exonuclease V) alpha subunit